MKDIGRDLTQINNIRAGVDYTTDNCLTQFPAMAVVAAPHGNCDRFQENSQRVSDSIGDIRIYLIGNDTPDIVGLKYGNIKIHLWSFN